MDGGSRRGSEGRKEDCKYQCKSLSLSPLSLSLFSGPDRSLVVVVVVVRVLGSGFSFLRVAWPGRGEERSEAEGKGKGRREWRRRRSERGVWTDRIGSDRTRKDGREEEGGGMGGSGKRCGVRGLI